MFDRHFQFPGVFQLHRHAGLAGELLCVPR